MFEKKVLHIIAPNTQSKNINLFNFILGTRRTIVLETQYNWFGAIKKKLILPPLSLNEKDIEFNVVGLCMFRCVLGIQFLIPVAFLTHS